jgi:hypothetical protein
MTAPTEKVDGPTPAATPANGNGVVTGVDGQRSSAARPGASLSPASNELRRTRSGVGRYLRRPESPEGYLAVSAAQPLVMAACEMLTGHTERGRGQAAPDLGPAEIAPCLCLLRGAIAAMLPAANAPDPIVGQLAGQLRLVVEHLERRTAGR